MLQDTLVTARKREEYPLPHLESRPDIRQRLFLAGDDSSSSSMTEVEDEGAAPGCLDGVSPRPTAPAAPATEEHFHKVLAENSDCAVLLITGMRDMAPLTVRSARDFPRSGIVFRHVLDIAQQPGGLDLCTPLLQAHFAGDWRKVDVVACCEFGGMVYASALAMRVGASLALIREAGKLPRPTVSVTTRPSHISSFASRGPGSGEKSEKSIEPGRGAIPTKASVVVVDDVLASRTTLFAVLQLLDKAGVGAEKMHVMVVAEYPTHRGRETLRRRGFGRVQVQSLVILDGV
ncbi:hypothetical protein E4U43_003279 [Claviceps pusilla]|uniref:adenine phosphoribosyltransferase n=1 Tax=Claviceps pusilla TaxID=123648 RepID=A0A9P7SXT8_9HYPO|nr:hypothetical protein E4U43_003279 [Claviceps pusilla]